MYRIIKDNELYVETENVCYVKYEDYMKSFCVCDEDVAQAVLVQKDEEDSFYANIYGKEPYSEDFPTVIIDYV